MGISPILVSEFSILFFLPRSTFLCSIHPPSSDRLVSMFIIIFLLYVTFLASQQSSVSLNIANTHNHKVIWGKTTSCICSYIISLLFFSPFTFSLTHSQLDPHTKTNRALSSLWPNNISRNGVV